jgi:plasmid stabilization system protein ParE
MLTLGKEAENDISEAYSWYEGQREHLGSSFLSEVDSVLKNIQEKPQLYACVHGLIRRALCRRFPYAIYYIETDPGITVLAILQQSRSPTKWQKRK